MALQMDNWGCFTLQPPLNSIYTWWPAHLLPFPRLTLPGKSQLQPAISRRHRLNGKVPIATVTLGFLHRLRFPQIHSTNKNCEDETSSQGQVLNKANKQSTKQNKTEQNKTKPTSQAKQNLLYKKNMNKEKGKNLPILPGSKHLFFLHLCYHRCWINFGRLNNLDRFLFPRSHRWNEDWSKTKSKERQTTKHTKKTTKGKYLG